MKLDTIALIIVGLLAAGYALAMMVGIVTSGAPIWPFAIAGAIFAYLLYKVVSERVNNEEDNYYEKNIEE